MFLVVFGITDLGQGRRMDDLGQARHHRLGRRRAERALGPVALDGAGMTDRTPFLSLRFGDHGWGNGHRFNWGGRELDTFSNSLTCDQWPKRKSCSSFPRLRESSHLLKRMDTRFRGYDGKGR